MWIRWRREADWDPGLLLLLLDLPSLLPSPLMLLPLLAWAPMRTPGAVSLVLGVPR